MKLGKDKIKYQESLRNVETIWLLCNLPKTKACVPYGFSH